MRKQIEILDTDEDYDDEYYDVNGNVSSSGRYDVGGNPIPERWAVYSEWLSDQARDREFEKQTE